MATNMSQDPEKERAIVSWRNKMETTKKGDTLREIQKLKVQIQALEREKSTHLYSRRSDFRRDFSQLEEIDTKLTEDRKTEQLKLKQQLEKISHMVIRFRKELRDVKPTPEFVERLKQIMEEIEGTINAFKDQQRTKYEEILHDERTTWQELQALDKKFDSWAQLGSDSSLSRKPQGANKPLASARDITKDLPPEVAAFEKFVEQNGGVRGGWDEYDHQTFLKFRQRYSGRQVFIQHALRAIPTRSEEEVQEHEEWYQEYLFLNESKKEAIKTWREKREEEKEELLAKASKEPEETATTNQDRLKDQIEQERMERKSKLNAWKVQKELERAQEQERKLRQQLDTAKKKEEWKSRQEEMHARVQEHRRQKQEEEEYLKQQEAMWEEQERERQKQLSAREIAKFRQRDERALQSRLAKEKAKEEEEIEKERRLARMKNQVEIEVDRDPNRLLKPTAGWKHRLKDKGPSGGGPVLHMPHRAVPAWRQGP